MEIKIGAEAGAAVSIGDGLPDPAAPLDPPLVSEAENGNLWKYLA